MTDTKNLDALAGWAGLKNLSNEDGGKIELSDENGNVILSHTPPETVTEHKELTSYIQRIERLEAEKQEKADDIAEVYLEAKGTGFDVKIMRMLVAERKKNPDDVSNDRAVLDLYREKTGGVV